ncbi:MAG: hypothetical protein Q4B84_04455 [Clostridia bacterium]|nr:hypothetical protein [Clostridia bacterium]
MPEPNKDYEKMQLDAINKLKEIYSKSKNPINSEKTSQKSSFDKKTTNHPNRNKMKAIFSNNGLKNLTGKIPNLIDLIFKDKDKTLIIILIILLMDNEENFTLLLALFYLLI